MSKPVDPGRGAPKWTKFSDTQTTERGAILETCRELTDGIYEGLDVEHEIRAVADHKLGALCLFGMTAS